MAVALIQSSIGGLGGVTGLPGVSSLIAAGNSLLSSICGVIAAYPLVSLGGAGLVAFVGYLPDIVNRAADWIERLRFSWNRLTKSNQLSIEELAKMTR